MLRKIPFHVALLQYRFDHWKENFWMYIANHLIPKELAKWVFVRVAIYKEMENPGERKCGEALKRFMES